jgi:general secretion pathway protein G
MSRQARGFTLIELLIVVAIIGIIAAIAIPNLMGAIDRTKQKRTMADMKQVGSACEQYMMDFNKYPTVANGTVASGLNASVEPTYIKKCPTQDGWGSPLEWVSDGSGSLYSVMSYGKGGVAGPQNGGITNTFADDIVLSNGTFTQWPEGQQR